MQTELKITREDIFRKVASRMEWEGTRNPIEGNDYGRVSVGESDRSLLHSLFDEAAMHAMDLCRPFLASASNSDESLTMKISIPPGQDSESLRMAVDNMMTTHVLAQWQDIVIPPRAQASFAKRDDYAGKVLAMLYHHPVPKRHKAADMTKHG